MPEAFQPSQSIARLDCRARECSLDTSPLTRLHAPEFLVAVNDVPSQRQQLPENGAETH